MFEKIDCMHLQRLGPVKYSQGKLPTVFLYALLETKCSHLMYKKIASRPPPQ